MKNFQILNKIGEGSYSSVWKVIRISDRQEYALKKVNLGQLKEKEKENALNEVRILASIDDPYIIGYKDAFVDEQSCQLCIIMEYAESGDLQKRIDQAVKSKQHISEKEVWKMLYHVAQAMKTLHSMTILHRDLKSANIFLQQGLYKLGDMNVSKVAKKGLVYTQTGTPYYASPEVWRDEPYDTKSDIWSLGCVAYEMASLKPPFRASDMEGLYKRVQKGVCERIPGKYSSDLMQIISICLSVNPTLRPSCEQLLINPIFTRNISNLRQKSVRQSTEYSEMSFLREPEKNILLQTIRVPRNLKMLQKKLPKSKYTSSYDGHVSFEEPNQIQKEYRHDSSMTILSRLDQYGQDIKPVQRQNQYSSYDSNPTLLPQRQVAVNVSIDGSQKRRQKSGYKLYVDKSSRVLKDILDGSFEVPTTVKPNLSSLMNNAYDDHLNHKLLQKQRQLLGNNEIENSQKRRPRREAPSIRYQNPDVNTSLRISVINQYDLPASQKYANKYQKSPTQKLHTNNQAQPQNLKPFWYN